MKGWQLGWALVALASTTAIAAESAPSGRLPRTVTPDRYRLELNVDPRQPEFGGRADIAVTVHEPTTTVWLHGLGLRVAATSAVLDGGTRVGRYEEVDHEFGVARITFAEPLPAGRATLRFKYRGRFEASAQGLYRTRVGDDWYAYTQFEAIDARRMFPGFDEPGFKTPFEIVVVAPAADRVVGNMPEARARRVAGGAVRHEFRATPPLPTYLVALALGPLDVVDGPPVAPNEVRREPLPLRVIGVRGSAARLGFALRESPHLIERLERYFAIPFPYPKIDLIASPIEGGAMENAGAIIFGESLLAFAQTPTPRQQSTFGVVAAHELAHQWFGDLVTPPWWDDIWLNESFAEWMGNKVADAWRPGLAIDQEALAATLGAMSTDALGTGRPVHEPVTGNAQIATTFDEITYQKGGGVIAMVESFLGAERFQQGIRLHLGRHRHATATAADFFAAMAEAGGDPALIRAFRSFVDQPGVPLVVVGAGSDGSLALEQSRYRPLGPAPASPQTWTIPFCASIYVGTQISHACTLLDGARGALPVPAAARGGVVLPNAGGAGYYRFALDAALLHPLLDVAPRLPAREALVLADSAAAAFEAGKLSFAELWGTARVLARHPDMTAATNLGFRLEELHDRLATPAQRPLLEHALVALYRARLDALGYDTRPGAYATDAPERHLERRQLAGLVAMSGRDAEVRRALAAAAGPSLADPERVEPMLRWRVWAAGLAADGEPVLARLKSLLLDSRDAQIRNDAAAALGSSEAPALQPQVLALVLEPRLELGVALGILGRQIGNPVSRDGAWRWLEANREAVIARVPAMFQSYLASLGSPLCGAADRQRFEALLGARLRGTSGGEIEVGRTLGRIDNCTALRAATGDSIAATLVAFATAEPAPR